MDGFGSGTTFIAALQVGRCVVGTEPDPEQFEAARDRLTEQVRRRIAEDQKEVDAQRREQDLEKKELRLQRSRSS